MPAERPSHGQCRATRLERDDFGIVNPKTGQGPQADLDTLV
jgi:hypothetical protein